MKVRARNGPDASAWRYRQACMTEIATLQRVCRSRASDLPTHGASARHCSRENSKFRAISVGQIAHLTLGDVAGDEHQRAVRPSGPIPKFVSIGGTLRYELRNQRTTSNFMIL